MKMHLGVVMTAALLLTACAAPQPPAPTAAAGSADQTQTASAAPTKKKCSGATGSRLGSCDGSTPEVQGSSGDSYRDSAMRSAPIKTPN